MGHLDQPRRLAGGESKPLCCLGVEATNTPGEQPDGQWLPAGATFLQEYFDIYPAHGVFNWTKLDAYMDSFAQTGTKLLATINFKPLVLFPEINQDIWRPNNVEEYQNLIYQLVRRYSVEKPIVTHWEHANEADYGWWGGCPFRFGSIEESVEFYQMLLKPILEAFPAAKVGGPCPAMAKEVPGFVELCARHGTQLDFVTYHG